MASLIQNITRAIADFNSIKSAIMRKNIEVPNNTPTSEYPQLISQIEVVDDKKIYIDNITAKESIDAAQFISMDYQEIYQQNLLSITMNVYLSSVLLSDNLMFLVVNEIAAVKLLLLQFDEYEKKWTILSTIIENRYSGALYNGKCETYKIDESRVLVFFKHDTEGHQTLHLYTIEADNILQEAQVDIPLGEVENVNISTQQGMLISPEKYIFIYRQHIGDKYGPCFMMVDISGSILVGGEVTYIADELEGANYCSSVLVSSNKILLTYVKSEGTDFNTYYVALLEIVGNNIILNQEYMIEGLDPGVIGTIIDTSTLGNHVGMPVVKLRENKVVSAIQSDDLYHLYLVSYIIDGDEIIFIKKLSISEYCNIVVTVVQMIRIDDDTIFIVFLSRFENMFGIYCNIDDLGNISITHSEVLYWNNPDRIALDETFNPNGRIMNVIRLNDCISVMHWDVNQLSVVFKGLGLYATNYTGNILGVSKTSAVANNELEAYMI